MLSAPAVAPAVPPARARARSRIRPGWVVLSVLGVAALAAGSWFLLPVRTVEVTGNTRLPGWQVKALAGLDRPGQGWLYYGARQAQGLLENPWIGAVTVTRRFPGGVSIAVQERQPVARWGGDAPAGQTLLVAGDGTLLPRLPGITLTGTERLPLLSGWGPERRSDALLLARALSRYAVQSVTYNPSGFTVKAGNGTAWSGDLQTFVKYAGSIGMYPDKRIHIYPWGVSVQE